MPASAAQAYSELEDRFGPPPPAVDNLLDYAVLKALCEKLLVASVERHGSELAVKFHAETPVNPGELVRIVRPSLGMRLDPAGVLWMPLPRGKGSAVAAVRNVLLELQSKG